MGFSYLLFTKKSMNSLNRNTINLKEEHQFSPEILNKDNQTGLCVCGLPQDNPLHGTMNSLNRDMWEEEHQRLKEDFDVYLQFIPKAYCQMCDSSKYIVENDDENTNKQYPWFCMECEDASEVVSLKNNLLMDIEEEITQAKAEERKDRDEEWIMSMKLNGVDQKKIDEAVSTITPQAISAISNNK